MLENLEKLIREQAGAAIINNSEVPDEKNEAAIQAASSSIVDTLKERISSGDLSSLTGLLKSDGSESDGVVQNIISTFTGKLQGLGINAGSAKGIAASLIPVVIAQFTRKVGDPNDKSFNLQDIVSSLSGPDGKFQLSDLTGLLGGSGNKDGKGGLMDNLKGLFS